MSNTTTIEDISKKAEIVLAELGVNAIYGYGEVYHFKNFLGQDYTINVPLAFEIKGVQFQAKGSKLFLKSEIKVLPSPDEEREQIIQRLEGMVGNSVISQYDRDVILRQLKRRGA